MRIASEVHCSRMLLTVMGFLTIVALIGCSNWTKQKIEESKSRGNRIIAAIEKYNLKHHRYPAKIEDMVPAYLPKIEPPVAGNGKWIYVNEGSLGYFLGFGGDDPDGDPIAYFSYSLKEWVMDTR